MYAQNARPVPGSIPVPENYSGNAFRFPQEESGEPVAPPPMRDDVRPEEKPDTRGEAPFVPLLPTPTDRAEEKTDAREAPLRFPFFGQGIGSEELLLLGLLLLLGGEEKDGRDEGNLMLCLLLLLFCG